MQAHSRTSNWLRNLYQESALGLEVDYARLGCKLDDVSLGLSRDMQTLDALMRRLQRSNEAGGSARAESALMA